MSQHLDSSIGGRQTVDPAYGSLVVFDDGALRVTRTGSPPRLVLAGEIDVSSYAGLIAALSDVTAGHRSIHIDLARVQYCDLAGLRAIVRLSQGNGHGQNHSGRCVTLHGLPAQLKSVLQVLGWDSAPGLVIAGHSQ